MHDPRCIMRFILRAVLPVVVGALVIFDASTALAATYYIDYASGSNSNAGTSKSAPWKSHPYMQTSSACTGGAAPTYSHAAGDAFIFKGGVSWPAACFQMTIAAGGSSASVRDYYGVDPSWYAGGSWARPKFDLAQQVPVGYPYSVIYMSGASHVVVDSLEVADQGIKAHAGYQTAFGLFTTASDVVVEGVYMHDWVTSDTFSDSLGGPDYGSGAVSGPATLMRSPTTGLVNVFSDKGGFAFNSAGNKIAVPFGGGCTNCAEVSYTKFDHTMAGCFSVSLCHDNEFTGITQALWSDPTPTGFALTNSAPNYANPHTQVIENDRMETNDVVYNNVIHDNGQPGCIGVVIYESAGATIFNNVMWNNCASQIQISGQGTTSASVGNIYNNTVDCSPGNACFRMDAKGTAPGTVNLKNNIWITNGSPIVLSSAITTFNQSSNHTMPTTEASTYGFTNVTRYAPTSLDSAVVGQGVNLSSACSGGLTSLCDDTEGAAWYGGTSVARPSGTSAWTLGAYAWPLGAVAAPDAGVDSGSPPDAAADGSPATGDASSECPACADGASSGCSCDVTGQPPRGQWLGLGLAALALGLRRRGR